MIEDNNNNLIWLDLEMTGLGEEHVILEVAIIITDEKLNIMDKFPDSKLGLAIKRSEEELSKIEPWSLNQHTKSGLLERSKKFKFDKIAAVESRGFVFASAVSYILKKPFIMLRKKDKLPADTHSIDFELEYGTATIDPTCSTTSLSAIIFPFLVKLSFLILI